MWAHHRFLLMAQEGLEGLEGLAGLAGLAGQEARAEFKNSGGSWHRLVRSMRNSAP